MYVFIGFICVGLVLEDGNCDTCINVNSSSNGIYFWNCVICMGLVMVISEGGIKGVVYIFYVSCMYLLGIDFVGYGVLFERGRGESMVYFRCFFLGISELF